MGLPTTQADIRFFFFVWLSFTLSLTHLVRQPVGLIVFLSVHDQNFFSIIILQLQDDLFCLIEVLK